MGQAVRTVYEHGHLRLLEPVNLIEGQEIEVTILSERERVESALGGLIVKYSPDELVFDDIDDEALLAEIDGMITGNPCASDAIIEERQEGVDELFSRAMLVGHA